MGAIDLRRDPLTANEQQRLWQIVCADPALDGISYRVETDAWGGLQMSPTQTKHSRMARKVARLLEDKLVGEAMPELAIITSDGVKVPNIAWCSNSFLNLCWSDTVLTRAPEICVEIVSPSNSEAEFRAKIQNYLDVGAVKVWLVSEQGEVEVSTKSGIRSDSSFGFDPSTLLRN